MIYFVAYMISVPITAALLALMSNIEGYKFSELLENREYKIGFYTASLFSPLGLFIFLAGIMSLIYRTLTQK